VLRTPDGRVRLIDYDDCYFEESGVTSYDELEKIIKDIPGKESSLIERMPNLVEQLKKSFVNCVSSGKRRRESDIENDLEK
jgi:hypothetical protein